MLDFLWDVILDTLLDGVKLLPFLFLAYLAIEWLELKASDRFANGLKKAGRFGPAVGALLGCVPQCGFSVAASNFYAGGVISAGTLLAVYLSTSDEAVLILMSHPDRLKDVGLLLLSKVVIAVIFGFLTDALLRLHRDRGTVKHDICEDCHCEEEGVLRSAIHHTLKTLAFILLVMFLLGLLMESVGEKALTDLLMTGSFFQPFLTALVGFIPNCAASVLLTQLYLEGVISFGSAVAGLCTGAGVGLAVLWRMNRSWKENLQLMLVMYLVSVLSGVALMWVG